MRVHAARLWAGLLVGLAVVGVAGCGGPAVDAGRQPLVKVTYVTSFGAFGRDAYAFVAKEKGFFAEAGFDVEIRLGAATGENLKLIDAGTVDFGAVDFTGALLQWAAGVRGFTAVAAVHQNTLAGIMTVQGRGIGRPNDLPGRVVADPVGSVIGMLWPVYARLAGVDPASVRWQAATPAQLPGMLAAGRVDAIGQFVVGVPTIEKATGGTVVLLPYSDYLTDLYGNALVTRDDLVRERPELVARFRDALLKGLVYAITHPQEAGQALSRAQPSQDATVAAEELRLMAPYVRSGVTEQVGVFSPARVMRGIALLESAQAVPLNTITPTDVVTFALAPGGTPAGR